MDTNHNVIFSRSSLPGETDNEEREPNIGEYVRVKVKRYLYINICFFKICFNSTVLLTYLLFITPAVSFV